MSQTIQSPDYATVIKCEIGHILPRHIVDVINPTTIQIVSEDGLVSSVRIRDARSGSACDVKVTHGGKSKYEDTGAKVVGEAFTDKDSKPWASIKEKAIKEIASQSTDWDIINISEAHADIHNAKRIHEHPSIHWARGHNADGKVGISVEIQTPNADQWSALKKANGKSDISPAPVIPSGKIIFKIISEEDVDFNIDHDRVSIQGTIAQVDKVIARITGNPFSDW